MRKSAGEVMDAFNQGKYFFASHTDIAGNYLIVMSGFSSTMEEYNEREAHFNFTW